MSTVVSSDSEPLASKTTSTGEEEKTIPFLRRLRDMLQENEEVVSFYPGSRSNGQTVLGRIAVHDRARVEAEVLPRYFNHASFASLRRQLNYFSFTRLGKGRQRGATYCNDGVVELDDILLLKRRPSGAAAAIPRAPTPPKEEVELQAPIEHHDSQATWNDVSASATANDVVPFVHLPPVKKRRNDKTDHHPLRKRSRFFKRESPTVISPQSSTPTSEDELASQQQQIILDLTIPSARMSKSEFDEWKLNPTGYSAFESYQVTGSSASPAAKDEDIMAGCEALLSFAQGASRLGFA